MEKIVLSDVPNEIYPRLEDLFISLVNKSGFPEVKIERKVDFKKLYKEYLGKHPWEFIGINAHKRSPE